jgi:hypothetical protein
MELVKMMKAVMNWQNFAKQDEMNEEYLKRMVFKTW